MYKAFDNAIGWPEVSGIGKGGCSGRGTVSPPCLPSSSHAQASVGPGEDHLLHQQAGGGDQGEWDPAEAVEARAGHGVSAPVHVGSRGGETICRC